MKTKLKLVAVMSLLFAGLALFISIPFESSVVHWVPRLILGSILLFGSLLWVSRMAERDIKQKKAERHHFISMVVKENVVVEMQPETIKYFEENLAQDVVISISGNHMCLNVKAMLKRCFDDERRRR